ncbi:hypothetical protein [Burkholderia multivorans]|uniref:hypothetical protein n=1 Tax=Burkholderia multivorans TaxID=87883 RepID=UPI0020B3FD62|nr:hypothetical protein [Burkholderia multivorans]
MSDYFSDRQNGPRARTEQVISPTVWAGIVATVQALISSGAFGLCFPERCPDGQATCGGDSDVLAASVSAEMPGLAWPLEIVSVEGEGYFAERQPFAPDTCVGWPWAPLKSTCAQLHAALSLHRRGAARHS